MRRAFLVAAVALAAAGCSGLGFTKWKQRCAPPPTMGELLVEMDRMPWIRFGKAYDETVRGALREIGKLVETRVDESVRARIARAHRLAMLAMELGAGEAGRYAFAAECKSLLLSASSGSDGMEPMSAPAKLGDKAFWLAHLAGPHHLEAVGLCLSGIEGTIPAADSDYILPATRESVLKDVDRLQIETGQAPPDWWNLPDPPYAEAAYHVGSAHIWADAAKLAEEAKDKIASKELWNACLAELDQALGGSFH